MPASTTTSPLTSVPQGTWRLDPVHSTAGFAVKHMVVATFRGGFERLDASLIVAEDGSGRLEGVVRADSVVVKDENLQAHLSSPEFFDSERYPEIRFTSTDIRLDGDEVVVDGDLTIKDHTVRTEARGTLTGPVEALGATKLGLTLETVIDRTEFGLNWNAPLPKGGFALANEVTLTVELELAQDEG